MSVSEASVCLALSSERRGIPARLRICSESSSSLTVYQCSDSDVSVSDNLETKYLNVTRYLSNQNCL